MKKQRNKEKKLKPSSFSNPNSFEEKGRRKKEGNLRFFFSRKFFFFDFSDFSDISGENVKESTLMKYI